MEQLVPIEDVAKHFNVSVSTARKWVRDAVIPNNVYIRVGKTHRFSLPDVTKALMSYDSSVSKPRLEESDVDDEFDPSSFDPDADV
tara:strand:- start:4980 stop:5237 length:258 start_codon:yes stop_codon:yes gene_type:complete